MIKGLVSNESVVQCPGEVKHKELVFFNWTDHKQISIVGVANGKIRDSPRRRDPELEIRARDSLVKSFETQKK